LRVNGDPEDPSCFINKSLMKTIPEIQIKALIILSTFGAHAGAGVEG